MWMMSLEMVKQKKRTRITQSGKNYAINLRHPGRALDLKAKDLIGHLLVSLIIGQSKCLVCYLFLHWINSFLHCFQKNCTALNQSEWILFVYIIRDEIRTLVNLQPRSQGPFSTSRKYPGCSWSGGYACQPKPHRGWVFNLILSTFSSRGGVFGTSFLNFLKFNVDGLVT